jgi:hypothetical protein
MHKIDGAGHVANSWVPEDIPTNRPPTEITSDWMNAVQEELVNVVEGAGLNLNKPDNTQLLTAINRLIKGGDYKASVRVATDVAINLAAPGAVINGVAMVAGDRFLDKDNATLADRGIYIWNGAAVPATRALDADTGAELNGGAIIPVEEGTVNADTNWQITNDGVVTIGVTGLTFQQVGAALSQVLPGTGIDWYGPTAPPGYLACPLSATNISRTTYAALFAAIGTQWGVGDGATTFGMPWYPADYASVQANANVSTNHVGQVISHVHPMRYTGFQHNALGANVNTDGIGAATNNSEATGGAANLAAGVRVLKCVKY